MKIEKEACGNLSLTFIDIHMQPLFSGLSPISPSMLFHEKISVYPKTPFNFECLSSYFL